jgi:hypothetical protein
MTKKRERKISPYKVCECVIDSNESQSIFGPTHNWIIVNSYTKKNSIGTCFKKAIKDSLSSIIFLGVFKYIKSK